MDVEMKRDIKKRWIKALHSGDYQQGKSALRAGDKYCCLGVLCDLAVKDGVIPPAVATPSGTFEYFEGTDDELPGHSAGLPLVVQEWAGLDHSLPAALGLPLHTLNDEGMPFTGIATIIDDYL
jgi:hypothetical protein